jgi:hypothetical protein
MVSARQTARRAGSRTRRRRRPVEKRRYLNEKSRILAQQQMIPDKLHTDQVAGICKRYHVASISVFGSTAREEATAESDLDLLVTFSQPISLLQMVALERELTEVLGQRVDLLTEASLSPYLRDRILKERRLVYAA